MGTKKLSLIKTDKWIDIRLFFFFLLYQAPVGCIFFTGEHTSKKYSGYVHGAYLTGEEISQNYFADYVSNNEHNLQWLICGMLFDDQ